MRAAQISESRSVTVTPCSRSQSSPPEKVRDSPTIRVFMPNWRMRPQQYQQGARVVTMVDIAIATLASGAAEGVGFGVDRGVIFLHPAVAPGGEELALGVEHGGADGDSAFGLADARLVDGDFEHGAVAGGVRKCGPLPLP